MGRMLCCFPDAVIAKVNLAYRTCTGLLSSAWVLQQAVVDVLPVRYSSGTLMINGRSGQE